MILDVHSIADQLEAAAHIPQHPSYRTFARETVDQYRAMLARGIKVIPVSGTLTGTSEELFFDIAYNGRLTVAIDGAPMLPEHPLAEYIPEFGLTLNSMFRAVHDYYGHFHTRSAFETFTGELQAYRNHARVYSLAASPALYGETIAQLCWFYSRNEFVPIQKCAILPVQLV